MSPPQGITDCVFLNAQNWQTVARVATPLRRLGVTTALILDLDALIQEGHWSDVLGTRELAPGVADNLLSSRHECGAILRSVGRVSGDKGAPWVCKVRGLDLLAPDDRQRVESFLDELAKVGVFVVPLGALENWLRNLGVTRKEGWVVEMLTRLGSRGDAAYVVPGEGDVWAFLQRIRRWAE